MDGIKLCFQCFTTISINNAIVTNVKATNVRCHNIFADVKEEWSELVNFF